MWQMGYASGQGCTNWDSMFATTQKSRKKQNPPVWRLIVVPFDPVYRLEVLYYDFVHVH
jgi:hypothetical protein